SDNPAELISHLVVFGHLSEGLPEALQEQQDLRVAGVRVVVDGEECIPVLHQEAEGHVVDGVGVPSVMEFRLVRPAQSQRLYLLAAAIVGVQKVLLLGHAEEDDVSGRRRRRRRRRRGGGGGIHWEEPTVMSRESVRWRWRRWDRDANGFMQSFGIGDAGIGQERTSRGRERERERKDY
ncbi:hypothetical protein BHM03_00008890, partial [Ensete ventricosum]